MGEIASRIPSLVALGLPLAREGVNVVAFAIIAALGCGDPKDLVLICFTMFHSGGKFGAASAIVDSSFPPFSEAV